MRNGMIIQRIEGSDNKEKLSLLGVAILLFVINTLWGFVFYVTTFENLFIAKLIAVVISTLFIVSLTWGKKGVTAVNAPWIIYAFVTLISLIISFNLINLLTWIGYYAILYKSSDSRLFDLIPLKFIMWTGIVAMIGVYLQFFFPSFYNTYINVYFQERFLTEDLDNISDLAEVVGMRGFFYNQSNTSIALAFGFVVLLYFKEKLLPSILQKKYLYVILITLVLVAVFFTGKRALSLITVAVPFIVWFLTGEKGFNKIAILFAIFIMALLIYYVVLPYLFESFDLFVFQRLQESLSDSKSGDVTSLTTGRDYLWNLAIKAWHEHPIFGIGAGNYIAYTHAFTDAHNSYLQILCEQGIFGFTFYIIAMLSSIGYTIKLLGKISDTNLLAYLKVSLASQFIYALYSFTGNPHIDFCMTMEILSVAITLRIGYIYKLSKRESRDFVMP